MKQILAINCIRLKQLKNFSFEKLQQFPLLGSLFLIIPMVLLAIIYLQLLPIINGGMLNPNPMGMWQSFGTFTIIIISKVGVFIVPLYLFYHQITRASFVKYQTVPIRYIEICLANILTFVLTITIIVFFLTIMMALVLQAPFLAGMILAVMLTFIVVSVLTLLLMMIIIVTTLFNEETQYRYTFASHLILPILIMLIPIGISQISVSYFFQINPWVLVFAFVGIAIGLYQLMMHISVKGTPMVKRQRKKTVSFHRVHSQKPLGYFRNQLKLMIALRKSYIEMMLSLGMVVVIMVLVDYQQAITNVILSVLVPMLLMSQGFIYALQRWYQLRQKTILKKQLLMNYLISISLITFSVVNILVFKIVDAKTITDALIVVVIAILVESFLKIKFREERSSSVAVFLIVYSVLVFVLLVVMKIMV